MRSRQQTDRPAAEVRAGSSAGERPGPCVRQARSVRSPWGRMLLAAALMMAPGCQLNRSFFQMDSNSRVPFFGIDLAPSWSKGGSSVDGVSRLQSEPREQSSASPPEAAGPAPLAPKSLALPRSESVVTSTASEGMPAEAFR